MWVHPDINIDRLNQLSVNTMAEWMGIRFTEINHNTLKATMPVHTKTQQPLGLLHGGASAALAETVGSVASWLCIDPEKYFAVGLEINCNHIRGKTGGDVVATATPLHIGKTTHVWDIKIKDEKEKLICVARLTMAIRKK